MSSRDYFCFYSFSLSIEKRAGISFSFSTFWHVRLFSITKRHFRVQYTFNCNRVSFFS